AAQEFEVVKLFVRGDFAGLGHGNWFCEKKAAAIAGVTDTFRNLRAPGEPCGVEGVLQKQGDVEFLCAEFAYEPGAAAPAAMCPFGVIGDEFVAELLIAVDFGDVGACDDANSRIWEFLADSANRGQRQDGVADPIRCANHDVHTAVHLPPEKISSPYGKGRGRQFAPAPLPRIRSPGKSPDRSPTRIQASLPIELARDFARLFPW